MISHVYKNNKISACSDIGDNGNDRCSNDISGYQQHQVFNFQVRPLKGLVRNGGSGPFPFQPTKARYRTLQVSDATKVM